MPPQDTLSGPPTSAICFEPMATVATRLSRRSTGRYQSNMAQTHDESWSIDSAPRDVELFLTGLVSVIAFFSCFRSQPI